MWSKVKDWCYHSETVAWGYFKVLAGIFLVSFHEIFDSVGQVMADTDVKQALAAMNFPAWAGLSLAVIGALTIYFRVNRTQVTKDNHLEPVDA